MKRIVVAAALAVTVAGGAIAWLRPPATAAEPPASYTPPSEADIPAGKFGDEIRMGEAIFRDPQAHAAAFVGKRYAAPTATCRPGGSPGQRRWDRPTCPTRPTAARTAT